MFTALEEWQVVPWIDPITKEEYPEVKYSMFKLLGWKHERQRKEQRKAEMKAKQARHI